ncbi:hypothetical protein [Psychromonas sp. SP041]|uniref:hypothetical protein n=1 Tax=Psychromonas sp. SP041 TaxID=1365007 RepID=UPI000407E7E9|nr:hypothetical protein [Psychromonas sp. SP041]
MNKIDKRVVIHTGPGKTGTSAIQAWLIEEFDFISAHGILYPEYKLTKEKISSGNRAQILTQRENGAWVVDYQKVKDLLARFKESKYSMLLLSSEFFFMHIAEISKAIPEAEFIAYIRNPIELIESNYNQSIKRHGKTQKFVPPKNLENYFWPYLHKVFNTLDVSKIHLRAYNKELMIKGSIISDLLSVLGVEAVIKDRNINPSFTFGALEFKRLCNYFELGDLDTKLDAVLQSCNIGTQHYSLMNKDTFNTLNNESCLQMKLFIEEHKQLHLIPLLNKFQKGEQRDYLRQVADFTILNLIAEHVKSKNKSLYKDLYILLKNNPNLVVDNPFIYDVFGVEPVPLNKNNLIDDALLKYINKFMIHPMKRGGVCFQMSCYFEEIGDFESSFAFAKAAYFFNPGHVNFIDHLNKLLIIFNESSTNGTRKIKLLNKIKLRLFSI